MQLPFLSLLSLFSLFSPALAAWPPERGRDYTGLVTSNGALRRYKVYAPGVNGAGYTTSCPGQTRFPLIFAFHGRGASAKRMTDISGLDLKSTCAIVVVPFGQLGTPRDSPGEAKSAWEPATYATSVVLQIDGSQTFPPELRDDKQFVADIMSVLWEEYGNGIRWDQVYATGKSSGAGFVNHLACTMPERFAAIAPVSGPFANPDPNRLGTEVGINVVCAWNHPLAVINFHGTMDFQVPYYGSPNWVGSKIPPLQEWAEWWGHKNGCMPGDTEVSDVPADTFGQTLRTHTWGGCMGGVEVRHYEIVNGVHDWPSLVRTRDNDDDESLEGGPPGEIFRPGLLNATQKILEFFRMYSLAENWFREIAIEAVLTMKDDDGVVPLNEVTLAPWSPPTAPCLNPFTMNQEVKWVQTFAGEIRSELYLQLTFVPETVSIKVDWRLRMFEGPVWGLGAFDLDAEETGSFILAENAERTVPVTVVNSLCTVDPAATADQVLNTD
ncbi:hypothetical protein EV426DRAFT_629659 [Tirmania nivea]|nr:hypothetical protein EV426DRAFT_629659 [Tirmania nivea]